MYAKQVRLAFFLTGKSTVLRHFGEEVKLILVYAVPQIDTVCFSIVCCRVCGDAAHEGCNRGVACHLIKNNRIVSSLRTWRVGLGDGCI